MKFTYLLNIFLACMLLASIFLISVTTPSSQQEYDPWLDYDENGHINILDAIKLAGSFNTFGDPTKNVNVMNWPISTTTLLWYQEEVPPYEWSPWYNASGYGHMHMYVYCFGLAPTEELRLSMYGRIWNSEHLSYAQPLVYEFFFNSSYRYGSVTIPVPGEEFAFRIDYTGPDSATISLNFYLTWA